MNMEKVIKAVIALAIFYFVTYGVLVVVHGLAKAKQIEREQYIFNILYDSDGDRRIWIDDFSIWPPEVIKATDGDREFEYIPKQEPIEPNGYVWTDPHGVQYWISDDENLVMYGEPNEP